MSIKLLFVGTILISLVLLWQSAIPASPQSEYFLRAPQKLFLWRVNGDRGTVFLLGSAHVARPDLYPLPREIEEAFSRAHYLVEETAPSKADPQAIHQFLTAYGRYADGDRLENHLFDPTRMALAICNSLGGPLPSFLRQNPGWCR